MSRTCRSPYRRALAALVVSLVPLVAAAPVVRATPPPAPTGGAVLDGWGGIHPFGGFTLNTTGAPYWSGWDIARSLSVLPDGSGGWTLDGWGGIHNWGAAPPIVSPVYWKGWDIARALYVLPDERSGYVLDGWGGIHPFGPNAPALGGAPYWPGWDIARGLDIHLNSAGVPDGGATLDGWGAIHPFGNYSAYTVAAQLSTPDRDLAERLHSVNGKVYAVSKFGIVTDLSGGNLQPTWAGYSDWGSWDILRDIVLVSDTSATPTAQPVSTGATRAYDQARGLAGGVTLDGWGGLHPFGGVALNTAGATYWPGWDIARAISVLPDGSGGWTLDGWGGIHNWGAAPPITAPVYWRGWDIARALYVLPDERSGYVLDGWGGIHPFGPNAPALSGAPYWLGHDYARGLDIHLNAAGVPDGGATLDLFGGIHVFGAYPPVAAPPEYWSGRDLYQQIHSAGGVPYVVQRWGQVDDLSGGNLQPDWSGYADWGAWDILRDTYLLGDAAVQRTPQPVSGAAANAFTDHAWVHTISAPAIHQDMPLDCESAALAVALNAKGVDVSQNWVYNNLPQDGRVAQWAGGSIVRWGNPYQAFVGNVFGSETGGTGYGVYDTPIAAVAEKAGRTATAIEGGSPGQVYDAVAQGNPVVIWTSATFAPVAVRHWTSWGGASIPYALSEHAVTVVGVNAARQQILLVDVGSGGLRTFSFAQFQAFWSSFGNMAVVVE